MKRTSVLIMGAAGRDFHNFNVYFRDNPAYDVVAFTATQIPNIDGRRYPSVLAGAQYPDGVPIYPESELERLIRELAVEQVVFAYSDVSHETVMHLASRVMAAGADFRLMGLKTTQIRSNRPVVAVCAVRTGCGKSQTSRHIAALLKEMGLRVAAVRHPMPYGDLSKQIVQRFATYDDLTAANCTIEEREEYEPHLDNGFVVYAGVDYQAILKQAEQEADVILWDGGNNDLPFYTPTLHITVVDPHRPGHEVTYHPGETNVRLADVIVINKIDTANYDDVNTVRANVQRINPRAVIVDAASPIFVTDPGAIRGKRVLVIEDGPTLTHGEMHYGAGMIAAQRFGAATVVDPRPYAVGSLLEMYNKYPHLDKVLPAMGYGEQQIAELEAVLYNVDADVVVAATPIDLTRVVRCHRQVERVRYELQVIGQPTLRELLAKITSEQVGVAG